MTRYLVAFSNIFFIQLFVGELLFTNGMDRKPTFWKRIIFSSILVEILSVSLYVCFYLSNHWFLYNTLYYPLVFILSLLVLMVSFDENFKTILLCGANGYLVQHIISQFILILGSLIKIPLDNTMPIDALISVTSELPIDIILLFFFYELFGRKTHPLSSNSEADSKLVQLSVITILIVAGLSSIRDYYAHDSISLAIISRGLSIVCSFLLLYLEIYVLDAAKKENERQLMEELYHEQVKQYQINKETIDLINEKCHDMRHQLALDEFTPAKEDLKRLISIYDNTIKTGNATLDTIFAQKSIICEKHGIRLSPIIDGTFS